MIKYWQKYLQHFLSQTVHLLLYFMMGVSVLSIILPCIGINFDYVTWGNSGGFSIASNLISIERFTFKKGYCWMTRKLPISMICVNIFNILCNELFPNHYELYGQIYEVSIFSLTLLIFAIISIEKSLKI